MMGKGIYQRTLPVWQPCDGPACRFYFCVRRVSSEAGPQVNAQIAGRLM